MVSTLLLIVSTLFITSSYGEDQPTTCTSLEGDILATTDLTRNDLNDIRKGIEKLLTSFNVSRDAKGTVSMEDLQRCPDILEELETQILLLDRKYEAMKSKYEKGSQVDADPPGANIPISSFYRPVDCADILLLGNSVTGVYTIYPFQTDQQIKALCDMDDDGGGWTVIDFVSLPGRNSSTKRYLKNHGISDTFYALDTTTLYYLTSLETTTFKVMAEDLSGEMTWAEWLDSFVSNNEEKFPSRLNQYNNESTMNASVLSTINVLFIELKEEGGSTESGKDKIISQGLERLNSVTYKFRRNNFEKFANCSG